MLHRRALAMALSVLLAGFALSPGGDGGGQVGAAAALVHQCGHRKCRHRWNQIAVDTLAGLLRPAGGAPSAAPVHVAMVQGAVYDAVNAIGPKRYRPYLLTRRFPAHASKDAAIATAAHGMLHYIVSTVPNLPAETRHPSWSPSPRSTPTHSPQFGTGGPSGRGSPRGRPQCGR